jgi:hypothetical protein
MVTVVVPLPPALVAVTV